jgi:protocatechuate 3,4-dioxygenase alpha subunit
MGEATPPQTIGPFFHDRLLRRPLNVAAPPETPGQRIRVEGRVLDGDGAPVDDAMVEIWQPDGQGRYASARRRDGFTGFGRSGTDAEGQFRFETIRPGRVPSGDGVQAPHLDVHVSARGLLDRLATRLYFDDEADNDTDPVLAAVPPARRATLIAARADDGSIPVYRLDIVLQGDGETVFFDA